MTTPESSSRGQALVLLIPALCTVLLGYLFYPTLREVALICWNDDDYSHGLLLPFVAGYMIYEHRVRIFNSFRTAFKHSTRSLLIGESLLLLGLLVFSLGMISGISYARWIAFFPASLGAMHLLFGSATTALLAWPLMLLVMAKPLPDSVVLRILWPLQVLAAKVSTLTLELFNVPVYLSGNIIEIPSMKLLVEEACSGMRSVISLLTLSLIVMFFIPLRLPFKLALAALSIAVAIAMNVFRVALTGLLAHFYDPETASGFFHTFSGMLVFVLGLPILYFAGKLLLRFDKTAAGKGGL